MRRLDREEREPMQKINGSGWLFSPRSGPEYEERCRREAKVKSLLSNEEDAPDKGYDQRLVRWLLGYNLPYRDKLVGSILLMAITSVLSVVDPWLIGQAIDEGIRAGDLARLRGWTIAFILVTITEWVTNRTRIYLLSYVGARVVADIRSELFRHLHRLSLNFYDHYSVGRLMSRLIGDVGVLQEFVTWSITGLTRAGFVLIGIMIAMLILNWQLAVVTFAVLPLMIWLTHYWRVRVRQAYRASRQRLALINGYLNESISGIRVTKSFSRERLNFQHFDDLNLSYFDANVNAAWLTATFFPGVDFIGSLATALVIGLGGWLVLQDALTAGALVAFVLYVNRFFDPIRELAERYNTFQATMTACERIFTLLNTPPDLDDAPDAQELPSIQGRVQFDHVGFSYKEGEVVLHDINLRAEPGQRVALVGETGAGKSTMIKLLARFFDVSAGSIQVDGCDLRRVTRASLRSQLGIVLQDTFLFDGTITDNIRYGRLDATDEEVMAAAQAVGAHPFISRLPEDYQTKVGENGVNLSVGQRQIISCARALLANPRLLILDEATSSVDTTTEKQIQHALDRLMEGRTSFVIAHRLSTIVNADKIVVLDQGRIVEMGSHQELLARRGHYYNLYTMQWAQVGEAARKN